MTPPRIGHAPGHAGLKILPPPAVVCLPSSDAVTVARGWQDLPAIAEVAPIEPPRGTGHCLPAKGVSSVGADAPIAWVDGEARTHDDDARSGRHTWPGGFT